MHPNDPTSRTTDQSLAALSTERRGEALAMYPGGPRRAASLLARAGELPKGEPRVMRDKLVVAADRKVERWSIAGWPQFVRTRMPFTYAKVSLSAASDELLREVAAWPEQQHGGPEPAQAAWSGDLLLTKVRSIRGNVVRVVESDVAAGEIQRVLTVESDKHSFLVVLHLWRASLEHPTVRAAYAIVDDDVRDLDDAFAIALGKESYDPLDFLDPMRGVAAVRRRVYTRLLGDHEWRWQPADPCLALRTPALSMTLCQVLGQMPPPGYNDLQLAQWATAHECRTVLLPIDATPREVLVTWHDGHGPLGTTKDGLLCMPEVVDSSPSRCELYPELTSDQQRIADQMRCGPTAGLDDGHVLVVGDHRWAVISPEGEIAHPQAVVLGGLRLPLCSSGPRLR